MRFLLALSLALPIMATTSAAEDAPDDPVHHALVQKKVGFYAVYLPPDYAAAESAKTRYPICVILHGSGSSELGHGGLSNRFGREGVIYIVPRAAHAHHEVFIETKKPGWTAWPEYPKAWGEWDSEGFPTDAVKKLGVERLYTDWVADCIVDARKRYRCDEQRVVVVGHSQGAAFANIFALHRPELVRGFFAYAGYYADSIKDDIAATAFKKHEIEIAIAHCEGDPVVESKQTTEFAKYLAERDVAHDVLIAPSASHGFTSTVSRAAHAFVARLCRGEELAALKGELVVTDVVPDSQGAALGLAKNDVLLSYDGVKLATVDDLMIEAGKERADDAEITLVWRRGEERMSGKVKPGKLGLYLEDR